MRALSLSIEGDRSTWFGCLLDDQDRLAASAFGPSSREVQAYLTKYSEKIYGSTPVAGKHRLTREMALLFDGSDASAKINLDTDLISRFQRRVYGVLERIPKSKVTTYGLISKHLDSAPRAVGGAVASNPWPLFIPCHRVVNADLTIGNYSMCGALGQTGSFTKRTLLDREDVQLHGDQIDRIALWSFSENTD